MIDPTPSDNPGPLEGNARLEACAARARETDLLAQEAEQEVARLRKEMKQARKAYREAKEAAKEAAKASDKARHELSECLDGAFRDLAMAVHDTPSPGQAPRPAPQPVDSETPSRPDALTADPEAASG